MREEIVRAVSGELPVTRQRMFLAAREVLVTAASMKPSLLIFDDLEFADQDTLDLVAHAGHLSAIHPLGIVAMSTSAVTGIEAFAPLDLDTAPGAAPPPRRLCRRNWFSPCRL